MIEDKKIHSRHSVVLDKRASITVTGVLDVISFDEESILTETDMGVLVIRGSNLHVSKLNLETGDLVVDGEIYNISYEDRAVGKGKGSFFGSLFK